MREGLTPVAFGRQEQSWAVLVAGLLGGLLSAGVMAVQLGIAAGVTLGLLVLSGVVGMYRNRREPCVSVDAESLVQHLGTRRQRYDWSTLRRPVRCRRRQGCDYLEIGRRDGAPPVRLVLWGLDEAERARLVAIVRRVVHGPGPVPAGRVPVRGN